MKRKTIKIPKNIEIQDIIGNWVANKVKRVKIGDLAIEEDFEIEVTGRDIIIKHPNTKQLNEFTKRLKVLVLNGGDKLAKMIT